MDPVVRKVLIVLLLVAAVVLAAFGGFDAHVNAAHMLAFAVFCLAGAGALLVI